MASILKILAARASAGFTQRISGIADRMSAAEASGAWEQGSPSDYREDYFDRLEDRLDRADDLLDRANAA